MAPTPGQWKGTPPGTQAIPIGMDGRLDPAVPPSTRNPMTTAAPSASYSFTVRLEIRNKPGMLGKVTSAIGKAGGDIGAVDLVEMTGQQVLRDITIKARDSRHAHDIVDRLRATTGIRIANISDRTFLMPLGGKIEISSKVPI